MKPCPHRTPHACLRLFLTCRFESNCLRVPLWPRPIADQPERLVKRNGVRDGKGPAACEREELQRRDGRRRFCLALALDFKEVSNKKGEIERLLGIEPR